MRDYELTYEDIEPEKKRMGDKLLPYLRSSLKEFHEHFEFLSLLKVKLERMGEEVFTDEELVTLGTLLEREILSREDELSTIGDHIKMVKPPVSTMKSPLGSMGSDAYV